MIALGDPGESKALDKVGEGLGSRNDVIVTASARAAGKLLAHPGIAAAAGIRDKLIALLSDPEADAGSRTAALESLVALKDDNLDNALAEIACESALENSELLGRVEKLLRERKVKL